MTYCHPSVKASIDDPVSPQVREKEEPRLPIELEREIFVVAFNTSSGADKTTPLQVAKRTQEWLVRLVYQMIYIKPPRQANPPLQSLQKYGNHVHYLAIGTYGYLPYDEDTLLSLCPNISDLALWSNPQSITETPYLFRLPLKRLTIHQIGNFPAHLTTNPEWCANLTHLAISFYDELWPSSSCQWLSNFQNLTHFLTGNWNKKSIAGQALTACPRLEVFIWLLGDIRSNDKVSVESNEFGTTDIRVVTINGNMITDWIRGAVGMDDMWVVAEREVVERRALTKRNI